MGKWVDLIGEDRSKIVEDLRQQFSEHPPGPTDLDAEMLLLSIRGFSYADIASVFRTSRTTVHKRVNRGRRNAAKLLLSRRHSRAVIDVLLTLEVLLADAIAAVENAATASADKWRALDRAASIAMRRYDVYRDLGLIERKRNEYQKIADRIEKLSLNQLEAERERLMRKIADAPKRKADDGKHNK
ncbi:MAG: hypothetical protein M5U25_09530 [Planctomycetota bacterium]|nr:hypothetical protein [Planctomycetota bacterium]